MAKNSVTLIKTCSDGTQSKMRIGKYMSFSPIENDLEQGDAIWCCSRICY